MVGLGCPRSVIWQWWKGHHVAMKVYHLKPILMTRIMLHEAMVTDVMMCLPLVSLEGPG